VAAFLLKRPKITDHKMVLVEDTFCSNIHVNMGTLSVCVYQSFFFLRPRFCASGPRSTLYGACAEPFLFVCALIYVYILIYEYIDAHLLGRHG
jgi:hypothetical protein